jgi:hypothetical protein
MLATRCMDNFLIGKGLLQLAAALCTREICPCNLQRLFARVKFAHATCSGSLHA